MYLFLEESARIQRQSKTFSQLVIKNIYLVYARDATYFRINCTLKVKRFEVILKYWRERTVNFNNKYTVKPVLRGRPWDLEKVTL